ncbi:MAG: CAAX farnesyltransferase (FTase) subunit beta [Trizodia sp. TS-e1964]|nr:MAG: CAAX farnesyltransferase (FTase) subunit beta [Trizodia sp. TS-e1964]
MSGAARGDSPLHLEKMEELAVDEAPAPPHGWPSSYALPKTPKYHLEQPVLRDALVTETSKLQIDNMFECMPFIAGTGDHFRAPFTLGSQGIPKLERQLHIEYLHQSLGSLPEGFVLADASRPWLIYWALLGLSLLGEDISPYCERLIATLSPMQNPDGGFGGGHGQMSHCATSYASILSLIMVGGVEALELINRRTLWEWLGKLKQPDGGFAMSVGGEEDVRGAYCVMVMISLLNLPIDLPPASPARVEEGDTLLARLPEYLSSCQTFEGGISSSPGFEAHGAYAFCALACFCILGEPDVMIPKFLDLPLLISWLSARQYAPEGGFAGRTNKLVDGCYSFWVGGCWPIVEAALNGPQGSEKEGKTPVTGSLYSRDGLIRYILSCCQGQRGGLRDKPSKRADAYHSCYVLAGLSSAQHEHIYSDTDFAHFEGCDGNSATTAPLSAAFRWTSIARAYQGGRRQQVFDDEDRVRKVHPIYVVPEGCAERARRWSDGKAGF